VSAEEMVLLNAKRNEMWRVVKAESDIFNFIFLNNENGQPHAREAQN